MEKTHSAFFVYTMSETTRLRRVMWSVYFPCGQDAVGQWNLSADKAKNYKLYNELCNLSKYCYAMKWGLTKRNYTKYTKKVTRT